MYNKQRKARTKGQDKKARAGQAEHERQNGISTVEWERQNRKGRT